VVPLLVLANVMDDVEHFGGGIKRGINDSGLEVDSLKLFWQSYKRTKTSRYSRKSKL